MKKELTERTLPSGMAVVLQRPALADLARYGEIPLTLTAVDDEETKARAKAKRATLIRTLPEIRGAARGVARACLVEPLIADIGDATHLGIGELAIADAIVIFEWANEPASAFGKFLKNKRAVWELYNQGQGWSRRPSEILRVEDAWAGYQLDRAVLELGLWVEAGLREKKTLELLLAPAEERPRKFASLKARGQRGKRDGIQK